MKHRDLLAAISDLDPIQVKGTFERHASLRWEELKASAAGGRWGASRAFEVLYLGRPPDSVVIEAYDTSSTTSSTMPKHSRRVSSSGAS